jgi:hypothetical protein
MSYDPRRNSTESYNVAIAAIREKLVTTRLRRLIALRNCAWRLHEGGKTRLEMERFTDACGTPVCLAGHASCDPALMAEGLHLVPDDLHPGAMLPAYNGRTAGHALELFFGIEYIDATTVFSFPTRDDWDTTESTLELIRQIDVLIEKYGPDR